MSRLLAGCWDAWYNWIYCCHPWHGPFGNLACWDTTFTYARCCDTLNHWPGEACTLIEPGYDYRGEEFRIFPNVLQAEDCCAICGAEPRCASWSWGTARSREHHGFCFLFANQPAVKKTNEVITSGLPGVPQSNYTVADWPLARLAYMSGDALFARNVMHQKSQLQAMTASDWWDEQLTMLKAAENPEMMPRRYMLRPPHVNFSLLLDALVPEGIRNHVALNIGGADGKTHDPVYPLFKMYGYGGLVIEPNLNQAPWLEANLGPVNGTGNVHVCQQRAEPHTIVSLLEFYAVPKDVDALKVDIDSFDLPLARAILRAGYSPKVVVMEVNPDVPPPFKWHVHYTSSHDFHFQHVVSSGAYGASPDALFGLFVEDYEYAFVGFDMVDFKSMCVRCEHNMWFVHRSFLGNAISHPSISWFGMVRLFWAQALLLDSDCVHGSSDEICLLRVIVALSERLGGHHKTPEASYTLTLPENRNIVVRFATGLKNSFMNKCAAWVCKDNLTDFESCSASRCMSSIDIVRSDYALSGPGISNQRLHSPPV